MGLDIKVKRMDASTRTAEEAAKACGCEVGQIVKSLVFQGARSGELRLLLVSGANKVDSSLAKALLGEDIERADPSRVRSETGFAIGGVAPIGHVVPLESYMDEALLQYEVVWAAAGAPNAVFSVCPKALSQAIKATIGKLG